MKDKFEPNLKCPQCGSKKIKRQTTRIREERGGPLVEQPPRLQCTACGHWESKEKPFLNIQNAELFKGADLEVCYKQDLTEEQQANYGLGEPPLTTEEEFMIQALCKEKSMSTAEARDVVSKLKKFSETMCEKYKGLAQEAELRETENAKVIDAMKANAPLAKIGPVAFPIYLGDKGVVENVTEESLDPGSSPVYSLNKAALIKAGTRLADAFPNGVLLGGQGNILAEGPMKEQDDYQKRFDPKDRRCQAVDTPFSTAPPSQWALEKAAQAWCGMATQHIEMDVRLATAFAYILDAAVEEVSKVGRAELAARLGKISALCETVSLAPKPHPQGSYSFRVERVRSAEDFYPAPLKEPVADLKLSEAILRGAAHRPETWMNYFDYCWDKKNVSTGWPPPPKEGPIGSDPIGAAFEGRTGKVLPLWAHISSDFYEGCMEMIREALPELLMEVKDWPELSLCNGIFFKTYGGRPMLRNLIIHLHTKVLWSREGIAEMLRQRGM